MTKVSAQALHPEQSFRRGTEIIRVDCALGKLVVYVRGKPSEGAVAV